MSRRALDVMNNTPDVFTLHGFCRLHNIEKETASVYLTRWRKAGMVEAAGERIGIYYNLIRIREVTSEHRMAALRFAYPSAILCGETVLHAAGWITQIPRRLCVAVLERPSYAQLHGIDLHGRSAQWFSRVHPFKRDLFGMQSISPAAALVDAETHSDLWVPDEDDLDIPTEGDQEIEEARVAIGGLTKRSNRNIENKAADDVRDRTEASGAKVRRRA